MNTNASRTVPNDAKPESHLPDDELGTALSCMSHESRRAVASALSSEVMPDSISAR